MRIADRFVILSRFYKQFAPVTITLSASWAINIFLKGLILILPALISFCFIYCILVAYIHYLRRDKLVFYYNLHLSPLNIWLPALFADQLIFLFFLIPSLAKYA